MGAMQEMETKTGDGFLNIILIEMNGAHQCFYCNDINFDEKNDCKTSGCI